MNISDFDHGKTKLDKINNYLQETFGFSLKKEDVTPDAIQNILLKVRDRQSEIVNESNINDFHKHPDYAKTIMIAEALAIMLKEVSPTQRKTKKVKESKMVKVKEHKGKKPHKHPHDKKMNEAKPDFLDLDKDGDKKEPMKKAAKEAKKAAPKKKIIKVKKSKNEPLSKENREIKSELRKIMNKHFGEVIKVYKKVLSDKIKYESEEEEDLLKEAEEDTNEKLDKVAKKYKIPKTDDSEFFESDRGFSNIKRLQSLKNSKIDLTTLSNYKELTKINKKLDEKFA